MVVAVETELVAAGLLGNKGRQIRQQTLPLLRHERHRDDVVRELRGGTGGVLNAESLRKQALVVVDLACIRIVLRCQLQILAEIATLRAIAGIRVAKAGVGQQLRGQCVARRRANLLALAFIRTKEEQLVLDNASADGTAELVLEAAGRGARERVLRQIGIVRTEVVRAAVERVRTRLGLHGHNGRNSLAQLGVKVLRGDLRFGNRIQRRIHNDDAQNRILVVGAVQLVSDAAEGLTVNLNLTRCLRIFVSSVGPAQQLCARQQKLQVGEVLSLNRKIVHLLRIEHRRYVSAVGLQFRLLVGIHFYRFCTGSRDLKRYIHARSRIGQHLNTLGRGSLESLDCDFDVVHVRHKMRNSVFARAVRGSSFDGALGFIRHCDRSA